MDRDDITAAMLVTFRGQPVVVGVTIVPHVLLTSLETCLAPIDRLAPKHTSPTQRCRMILRCRALGAKSYVDWRLVGVGRVDFVFNILWCDDFHQDPWNEMRRKLSLRSREMMQPLRQHCTTRDDCNASRPARMAEVVDVEAWSKNLTKFYNKKNVNFNSTCSALSE